MTDITERTPSRTSPISDAAGDAIPGWFSPLDRQIFRFFLEATERSGEGDLAELGAYLGKSAVLVGSYLHAGETFTVIDLFEDEAAGEGNAEENIKAYGELSQGKFEENYRSVIGSLPVVVRGPSSEIVDHAAHGTHRFVHIDASHLYEHVVGDVAAARTLLRPGGIVAFDDIRTEHTPGVPAAVWPELERGMVPLLVSEVKLYATFGQAGDWPDAISSWLDSTGSPHEVQSIAGHTVHRVWRPESRLLRWVPPVAVPILQRARRSLGRTR